MFKRSKVCVKTKKDRNSKLSLGNPYLLSLCIADRTCICTVLASPSAASGNEGFQVRSSSKHVLPRVRLWLTVRVIDVDLSVHGTSNAIPLHRRQSVRQFRSSTPTTLHCPRTPSLRQEISQRSCLLVWSSTPSWSSFQSLPPSFSFRIPHS